jgi:hypothetical protein
MNMNILPASKHHFINNLYRRQIEHVGDKVLSRICYISKNRDRILLLIF